MSPKTFLLAAILFLFINSLYGQSYSFRHYQVENGLSNNAVICSLQDKTGFLWFGTKDGLNRFDGYTFKIFRYNLDDTGSIGSNFIHSLYEDKNGILWVGTEKGLYQYNPITESFRLLNASANGQIRDIQTDTKGNLWFISGFTLFKYNSVTKKSVSYTTEQYAEATSIIVDGNGTLWVATTSGFLKKYDAASDTFISYDVFQHSPPVVSKWIERLQSTPDGSILIGTATQGVKLLHTQTGTYTDMLTKNEDNTGIFVRNFVQASDNEFWMGTETGIFIYNKKDNRTINLRKTNNDPYSISDNAVYTFCKDKEGGIWAGTYFGGINYYPKQYTPFKKYFPKVGENSLSGNVIREIHQDNYGHLWIGTEDAGLNKSDPLTGKFTHFTPTGKKGSIAYTNIHGLLVHGDELWIGTFEHGLDILNINTGNVIRHYDMGTGAHDLKSNFIYCIYQSPDGEIMIGTTRGVYTYNPQQDDFTPLPKLPLNDWYTSILKDENGVIWTGTYGSGVNYVDTKTARSGNFKYEATNKNSISSDRVNAVFKDSNKQLWMATEGGLCKFIPEKNAFKRYTTENGLPSNFILSILEDEEKNLWISTSKGLARFNLTTEAITVYTVANGLLNDQFNFNSAYKNRDGSMFFGSVKGMVRFNPADFTKNTFVPPVYITGFQLFNKDLSIAPDGSPLKKSITYTDKITLAHDQSTISIDFAALSYSSPETSEYAYKMEGLDNTWTYLKRNRKAYFTELAPGTYTFKVKAANSSGIWTNHETKLIIQVLPPWWASPLAYAVYILVAILLLYLYIRADRKRIEEKNRQEIEHLEAAKEKELFEAKIEFFTNIAHEIRTPLTLIKGPLEKVIKKAGTIPDISGSLKIMDRNTTRLIDLTNQLLDFRQTEIKGFSLSFVRANVTELVEETYLNFKPLTEQKNISYDIQLPMMHLYASVDVEALIKILTNLFSNAVKYAHSKVYISLFSNAATFTIEIKNDGYIIPAANREQIFEPFVRLKETEKQRGTGIGLALARSLVLLHKGELVIKEPQENMNVFSLTLPLHQEADIPLYTEAAIITDVNNNS